MSISDLAVLSDLYKSYSCTTPPWLTYALEKRKESFNKKGGEKNKEKKK